MIHKLNSVFLSLAFWSVHVHSNDKSCPSLSQFDDVDLTSEQLKIALAKDDSSDAFSLLQTSANEDASDVVSFLQTGHIAQTRSRRESSVNDTVTLPVSNETVLPAAVGAWQNTARYVAPEFEPIVSSFIAPKCNFFPGDELNAASTSAAARVREVPTVLNVPKQVTLNQPRVRIEKVAVPINITQDTLIYKNMTKKIPKIVPVTQIVKQNRTVEVPEYVEKVTNITINVTKPVFKDVLVDVTVKVPKIQVHENFVPVTLNSDNVVYDIVSQEAVAKVEVPEIIIRKKEVTVTKIEEIVEEIEVEDSVAHASVSTPVPEEVEVEVVKVKVREIRVPIQIYQDKVKEVVVKQQVVRKVEVPKLVVKRREVVVPQYKTVRREVPVVEVRQRKVEVIKEVPEIIEVPETVTLHQERVVESKSTHTKQVFATTQSPSYQHEVIKAHQTAVNIIPTQNTYLVSVTESTLVAQEYVQIIEQEEVVNKVVDVYVDREEIVEVPIYKTQEVIKEVHVVTTREEIVKIFKNSTVTILNEQVEYVDEEVQVDIEQEELVENKTQSRKNVTHETILTMYSMPEQSYTILKPTPLVIQNMWSPEDTDTTVQRQSGNETTRQKNISHENIVEDIVEHEVVQKVGELVPTIKTREVEVPVWNLEDEIVEVNITKIQEDVIKVPKVYEIETVVEVEGTVQEEVFEREVINPTYVDDPVHISMDVPVITHNTTDVHVKLPKLNISTVQVPKKLYMEEIVEVPKVVQVKRSVLKSKSNGNSMDITAPASPRIKYVERIVEQIVEVPVPEHIIREVKVPVYEVEEIVENVPVETIVEEIVEVPKVIEVEQWVEVPRIEYNDTVVEKLVKKQVLVKRQKPVTEYSDVNVSTASGSIEILEKTEAVTLKKQEVMTKIDTTDASQTTWYPTLEVKGESHEVKKPKFQIVKKRVEKLVPNVVERVVQKPVEVVHMIVKEKVVPVYSEKVIKKEVEVIIPKIVHMDTKKKLKRQVLKTNDVSIPVSVNVNTEKAVEQEVTKKLPLRGKPILNAVLKEVPVVVPCQSNVSTTPAPAPAIALSTTLAPIVVKPLGLR